MGISNLDTKVQHRNGIDWYVSGGPTVTHTEAADEFGDTELIGYLGGSKALTETTGFYGEISGVTAEDDVNWGGKVGVKLHILTS